MKGEYHATTGETLRDIISLIKQVSHISLWSVGRSSSVKQLGQAKAHERRMKEIRRLSGNIKEALRSQIGVESNQ